MPPCPLISLPIHREPKTDSNQVGVSGNRRLFRHLTWQFTRECVGLEADRSMTGMKVAQALERAKQERGRLPESITVDNGSEFCSRALAAWAMGNEVQLRFIRPGRPVENGFIESFNGRLRDECLNIEWVSSLDSPH